MESAPSIIVPDRPRLIVNDGKTVAAEFVDLLKKWRQEFNTIFTQKTNKNASWPPEDPLHCFRNYFNRPLLAREMAIELAALITEIESDGGKFGDKMLRDYQLGQLKWLVMALLEDGTSFLIENPPGVGKTIILGALMKAATRLQIRGIMNGVILYGTHKSFILSQQTFGAEDRRKRLRQPPRISELKQEWEYVRYLLGGAAASKIGGLDEWEKLRTGKYQNTSNAEDQVLMILENAPCHPDDLRSVASLLTAQSVLVRNADDRWMQIPLTEQETVEDVDALGMTGDVGTGVPLEYLQRHWVLSRRGADADEENVIGKSTSMKHRKDTRVVMTVAQSIKSAKSSIASLVAHAGIVLIDEGKNAATTFQQAVLDARKKLAKGSDEEPLVFMASALGITNGNANRPYADRYSLGLSTLEAMERGVVPNVGVDLFPHASAPLYPSGSVEAMEQLIEAHFKTLELPKEIGQLQPNECNSMIVVSPFAVNAVTRRLQEEYDRRGIPAYVIPFNNSKRDENMTGNAQPPISERVFVAMSDDLKDPSGRNVVKVMVSSPLHIADAVSLPMVMNITIGTAMGVSKNTLLRIFGRLQHSTMHHEQPSSFRGYFRQGLYLETTPEETLLHLLGDGADLEAKVSASGMLRLVPLQILQAQSACKEDAVRTASMKKIHMPFTTTALRRRRKASGKSLKKAEEKRSAQERMTHTKEIRPDPEQLIFKRCWVELQNLASTLLREWHSADIQHRLRKEIIQACHSLAPSFMLQKWETWEGSIHTAIDSAPNDPRDWLEAALRILKRGLELGTAGDVEKPVKFAVIQIPDDQEKEDDSENREASDEDEYCMDSSDDRDPDVDTGELSKIKPRDFARIFEDDSF